MSGQAIGDPFLIVLDEPNANLDHHGELALIKAIETLRKNRSIVVLVSHRPESISAVNMAMVLREGRVIAFGPREELFARVAQSITAGATKVNSGKSESHNARVLEGARSNKHECGAPTTSILRRVGMS